jgi:hypothetical protein
LHALSSVVVQPPIGVQVASEVGVRCVHSRPVSQTLRTPVTSPQESIAKTWLRSFGSHQVVAVPSHTPLSGLGLVSPGGAHPMAESVSEIRTRARKVMFVPIVLAAIRGRVWSNQRTWWAPARLPRLL